MNRILTILLVISLNLQDGYSKTYNLSRLMRFDNECVCGVKPDLIGERIVHGEKAKEHEYPWLVSIFNNGRLHCGGSLINDLYILTAGHCLNWHSKENLQVILGMHDRVLMESEHKGGTVAEIDRLIVHEDFSSDYMHDSEDIALIKLSKPVEFNDYVLPVCLPFKGHADEGKATVAGWGKTMSGGSPSRELLRTSVNLLRNEDCKNVDTIGEHITPSMLCAYEEGTDACQGDSGGPLFFKSGKRTEQIGVVSWGVGCANMGVPGIYTRLTKYLDWIVAHTKDSKYCVDPNSSNENQ